jgi:hypothetical protein
MVLFFTGIIFLVIVGGIGAYNFNHKYEGIEGVLVRMVRKVSKETMPNARVYFHLPKGHIYIGQMNYRLPLFENRRDLKATHFSADTGVQYKRGDVIIHHPWLSEPKNFPFFQYNGKFEKPEMVKVEHPYIEGANFKDIKRCIIAHITFPRDTRLKLFEKTSHHNWWEIYLVLSKTLTITSK